MLQIAAEMVRKKKFYAAAKGLKTGIFESWEACQKAIKGFKGAEFKSFPEKIEAETWLKEKRDANIDTDKEKPTESNEKPTELTEKHCSEKCTMEKTKNLVK